MEKPQLINFIAKVMEDSGFKVYKNFKTSQKVLDIYAILPTTIGDFGVVVACKNYDKTFDVGIDALKETEEVGNTLKASKVTIVTSSYFTDQASNYAIKKNIKLVDRDDLIEMANNFSSKTLTSTQSTLDNSFNDQYPFEDENLGNNYLDYDYGVDDLSYLKSRSNNPLVYENTLYKQEYRQPKSNLFSRSNNRGRPSLSKVNPSRNYGNRRQLGIGKSNKSILSTLLTLLKNPFVTLLFVILVSYILYYILGNLMALGSGVAGLFELMTALFLSYALSYYAERDRYFVIKGTILFFVSLIVLIILIFI